MKNIARITRDYDSQMSVERWREDLNNELEQLDVNVWTKDKHWFFMEQLLKNQDTLPDQFSNSITAESIGYVQGEYAKFQIYYNGEVEKVENLKKILEKTYTHKNDYLIEIIEMLSSGHSRVIDRCVISVDDVEFPELQDIVKVIDEIGIFVIDEYKLIE
tara:strand:- start:96 stop:575 length:480 start_codon:yes stop_codon:yes gene_type:complete